MAEILATFDKLSVGSVTQTGNDVWVDILSYGPDTNSPIPAGKRIWIGFLVVISEDKKTTFELRSNLTGQSTPSVGATQLRGFVAVPEGESREIDLFYNGAIISLAPVTTDSTGVEKLWLRMRSQTQTSSTFDFIFYYTDY